MKSTDIPEASLCMTKQSCHSHKADEMLHLGWCLIVSHTQEGLLLGKHIYHTCTVSMVTFACY